MTGTDVRQGPVAIARIELKGIEIVEENERSGRARSLFWPWFAANISVLGVSYGAFTLGFGVSFWQAVIAGIVGIVISFAFCGVVEGGQRPDQILPPGGRHPLQHIGECGTPAVAQLVEHPAGGRGEQQPHLAAIARVGNPAQEPGRLEAVAEPARRRRHHAERLGQAAHVGVLVARDDRQYPQLRRRYGGGLGEPGAVEDGHQGIHRRLHRLGDVRHALHAGPLHSVADVCSQPYPLRADSSLSSRHQRRQSRQTVTASSAGSVPAW
jgi:hypothetical protein